MSKSIACALLTIIFVLVILSESTQVYDLVKLSSTSALCLDGSNAAYYLSKEGDPKKVILYFQGGGWCGSSSTSSTLQSCYGRSKTNLGSSKAYAPTLSISNGAMSDNEANNFKDWKKVYIFYCDGSGHQGTRKESVKYKDRELYFRGHNNTVETLADLQLKIKLFSEANEIVVSGGSAGGLATFLWTNYVADQAKVAKVWSLPDSGIFLDSTNIKTHTNAYKTSFANIMKFSNVEIDPPVPECVAEFKDAKQNCMFAQNIFKHIKVPLFPIQSLYDTWSVPNILGISCIAGGSLAGCDEDQLKYIEIYHQNVTNLMNQVATNPQNGGWAPVCCNHVYSGGANYHSANYRIPHNSENSVSASVKQWQTGAAGPNIYMDSGVWPENKPCSGIQSKHHLTFSKAMQSLLEQKMYQI